MAWKDNAGDLYWSISYVVAVPCWEWTTKVPLGGNCYLLDHYKSVGNRRVEKDLSLLLFLQFLPGYPLLNFMVVSLIYVGIANRLFLLTGTLKNSMMPSKVWPLLFLSSVEREGIWWCLCNGNCRIYHRWWQTLLYGHSFGSFWCPWGGFSRLRQLAKSNIFDRVSYTSILLSVCTKPIL